MMEYREALDTCLYHITGNVLYCASYITEHQTREYRTCTNLWSSIRSHSVSASRHVIYDGASFENINLFPFLQRAFRS